jgi:predicted Ser/Thr protein kinase
MKRLGRYEILNELGRGGMGRVYRGRDPKIDRVVAIKTISMEGQSRAEEEEFRQRFFREARAAGALSHPGIVTIHDVGEDEATKTTFIVMEYVEGKTLGELAQHERLPLKSSLDLAKQVAEALEYAHSRNIVHRDIKPANIIITPEGRAKITDFGIAKLQTAPLTQPGEVLGTPAYMSPEQLTGGAVDGRSDIFSLGVILYWLLTGDKPFLGENTSSITYKIVYQDPIPPCQLNPSLSPDCDYVVQRALAKEQGKRYQRGREFAGDLLDLKAGRPLRSGTAVAQSATVGETVVSRRPKPSLGQLLGASFLAIFFDLLLLDSGIETFLRGLPTRRLVGIVVASYFALNVWLWRKMGWLVRAGLSFLVLLGLLAFAAWQRESCCEGIVLLGQTTSALLSVVTGGAVAFAGISLARLRLLGLAGRLGVALLTVYAVAAFVSGVGAGQPYPDLYRGASLWTHLPFWLQGAFVGSFVLLPVALVSLTLSGLLRSRETKFRRWGYTLLFLCLTLTMSVGGFKAPRGCTLVVPFGGGSIEAFISEEAAGTYGVTRSRNQVREDARRIYLIVQGRNTGPLSVEATWLAVNVDGSESNRKLGSSRLSLEPDQRKAVSLNTPRGGFLPGEYRVELSVSGGAPQSLLFKVAPILPLALPWRVPP